MDWVTREHPHTDGVARPRILHGADVAEDRDATPQSMGLPAIAEGFAHLGLPDLDRLALELPVHAALHGWCQHEVGSAA